MKKEEIKKYVAARNNTVLNFPDRGPWGTTGTAETVVDGSLHISSGDMA